jgi:hypothetical protein
MTIAIIGAGISGVMAYHYFKSKGYKVVVLEKNKYTGALQNHSSIFRTRTRAVSDILKCDAKEITVEKGYIDSEGNYYTEPTIMMKNEYSIKVSGSISFRSIYKDRADDERFLLSDISPIDKHDLIDEAEIKKIEGDKIFAKHHTIDYSKYDFCISTIPLPYLLEIVGLHSDIEFKKREIIIFRYQIDFDSEVYQTIYYTNPIAPIYRATLQEREIIIECMKNLYSSDNHYENITANIFGINPSNITFVKRFDMPFGKIIPIDDTNRRKLIMELSDRFNIFSLGRHAIWKNNVAADEVADDVKKIDRMINISSTHREYERRLGG